MSQTIKCPYCGSENASILESEVVSPNYCTSEMSTIVHVGEEVEVITKPTANRFKNELHAHAACENEDCSMGFCVSIIGHLNSVDGTKKIMIKVTA